MGYNLKYVQKNILTHLQNQTWKSLILSCWQYFRMFL